MTREAISIELEQAVCEIDAAARDNGHEPQPWRHGDATASTACRCCGATAAIRVRAGGTWKAGQLRYSTCTGKVS